MSIVKRGYFDVMGADIPSCQIHYRLAGRSGSPLILLHQSPLSSTQFEAVLPSLVDQGFHALALDLPGFGMSDALPDGASLDNYAAIIPAAMHFMHWPSVDVIGHHTGAVVAAIFAASSPFAVKRLVLNGFPILSAAEREYFATFYFGPKEPKLDGSHFLTAWHNRLRSTPGWSDLNLMHRYTVEGLYRGHSNWKAFPLIMAADLEKVLLSLTVPTLLLTNTGEDLFESTQRAYALRTDFFQYAELKGGTHDIIDEQSQAWVAAVAHFLFA